jgi:hypothetical protein
MAQEIPLTRREALKLIVGSLTIPLIGSGNEFPSQSSPRSRTTLLFFDDEPLYARQNLTRRLGTPRRIGSYHEPLGNCTWGRPAVFRTAEGWRMIYQAGIGKPNRGGGVVLLAASDDGLDWRPSDTRKEAAIRDRVAPHQILPDAGNYCTAIEDPRAPRTERFKLLLSDERKETSIWDSPDLVRWERRPNASWHPNPPDPPAFVFWNEVAGKYMITTRPEWPDRRLCLVESSDWAKFSEPRLILHADADDRAMAQHYGLYVHPYEGYYVGLLWVFYAGEARRAASPHWYRGGRVETYLAYSLNGTHWQRCFHEPLFRNGESGAPDAGCLQVSNLSSLPDGSLRAYGACSASQHGICPPDDGHIVMYELRRDGFVGLEAGAATGFLSTRALFWRGGEPTLNLDAGRGRARVRVVQARGQPLAGYSFEDCEALERDATEWTPRWRDGKTLSALANRMIRLEIELNNATLFGLRGDFVLVRLGGLERWEKENVAPIARPGF